MGGSQVAGAARILYHGPEVALIAFAVALAAWALGPASSRARGPRWRQVDTLVVLATLASGRLLISAGNATTNIFCPYQIDHYGGQVPYNKLIEPWPEGRKPSQSERGFPAGHAIGGYALLSLAGLARTARRPRLGLAIGLSLGTAMSGYQMLRGAHYLTHTVINAPSAGSYSFSGHACWRADNQSLPPPRRSFDRKRRPEN